MKSKMFFKLNLTLALTSLALLSSGCYGQDHELLRPKVEGKVETNLTENYTVPITVGNKNIAVEVADTDDAREQGLSGRPELTDEQGMLFDFTNTNESVPSFWMKGMKFAIDIIWINDKKIIGITANAPIPKNNSLPTYSPPGQVTHVLEVASGWSRRNNVKIGDSVKLK